MKGSSTIKSFVISPNTNLYPADSTINIIRIKIHGLPRAGVVYVSFVVFNGGAMHSLQA
jgi:hypothetical protein